MKGFTHIIPIQGAAGAYGAVKYAFAAGTYVGRGGATAPLITTGLKKVHNVWLGLCPEARSAATTAGVHGVRPCRAAGTPGGFYPLAFRIVAGATVSNLPGMGADATFKWLALGE